LTKGQPIAELAFFYSNLLIIHNWRTDFFLSRPLIFHLGSTMEYLYYVH
jgi:hypothetical protein